MSCDCNDYCDMDECQDREVDERPIYGPKTKFESQVYDYVTAHVVSLVSNVVFRPSLSEYLQSEYIRMNHPLRSQIKYE